MHLTIRELLGDAAPRLHDFVELSREVVEAGAHLGWDLPFDEAVVTQYWAHQLKAIDGTDLFLFGAFIDDVLVGTVQLERAHFPTSRHRGEIAKLMVKPALRRSGVATRLMDYLEGCARASDFELLVLDTRSGEPVEELYRRRGYTRTGFIPNWMKYANASYRHTVFFYKNLGTQRKAVQWKEKIHQMVSRAIGC